MLYVNRAIIQTKFWCSQFPCCSSYCLELTINIVVLIIIISIIIIIIRAC